MKTLKTDNLIKIISLLQEPFLILSIENPMEHTDHLLQGVTHPMLHNFMTATSVELTGVYKGVKERSFLFPINPEMNLPLLIDLAFALGQESVLTYYPGQGAKLLFHTNAVQTLSTGGPLLFTGVELLDKDLQNYTQITHTDVFFSF